MILLSSLTSRIDDMEADPDILSGRIPDVAEVGVLAPDKLARGAGFLGRTPSETDARGLAAPGPVEERRDSPVTGGDVTEARVVTVGAALPVLLTDGGREVVEEDNGFDAAGAIDALRAGAEATAAVLVGLPAAAGVGLVTLVVDVVEGVFLTVVVETGALLVDDDNDEVGFGAGGLADDVEELKA
jgi:hypothetical protein